MKEIDMTTTMEARASREDGRLERYRQAERELWARYGIDPIERFVDLAQPRVRLRLLEVGSGDPVLFVPGTGGTGPYWAPLVRELRGVRCIMLDRPGWGLSGPVDYRSGQDYGSLASMMLRGALDALALDRVDVVGASIGNLWALRLSQHEPRRVGRIVNVGGGPTVDLPVPRFIRLLSSPIGALMVRVPMSPKMIRSQLAALGHEGSLAEGRMDDFVEWRVAFARETPSMRHERAMVRAILGRGGWRPGFIPTEAELAAIEKPLLMIFGSADPTGSVDTWRRFATRFANGELQIVEGAGHMAWWDEPATVGRLVRDFLGRS